MAFAMVESYTFPIVGTLYISGNWDERTGEHSGPYRVHRLLDRVSRECDHMSAARAALRQYALKIATRKRSQHENSIAMLDELLDADDILTSYKNGAVDA